MLLEFIRARLKLVFWLALFASPVAVAAWHQHIQYKFDQETYAGPASEPLPPMPEYVEYAASVDESD
jgi:hypothetical protein